MSTNNCAAGSNNNDNNNSAAGSNNNNICVIDVIPPEHELADDSRNILEEGSVIRQNTPEGVTKCHTCGAETEVSNTTDTINETKIYVKEHSISKEERLQIVTGSETYGSNYTLDSCQVSPNKSEKICRICLDTVDEEDMIAPCKCSGSTKYAHESCMLKWFFKSSKKACEVCLGDMNVTPVGYKPVQEWRLPENGCDFIVYLFGLYFLIMVIFTGMITWIATQGCTSPVCVTLYCVCGIAVFYFFYCCGCVEYSRRYWKALLSVNKVWRIYGREDSLKNVKHHIHPAKILHTPESLQRNMPLMKPFVIEVSEANTNISQTPVVVVGIDNHGAELNEASSAT